ncbi:Drebrin [Chelonia mydas]|uniref:Drebrin n=1 Tax=Chelonia mydas TaxID=8469 RepID=M7BFS6_CHEMY|nr:Drebrin [Chelonia mydas]
MRGLGSRFSAKEDAKPSSWLSCCQRLGQVPGGMQQESVELQEQGPGLTQPGNVSSSCFVLREALLPESQRSLALYTYEDESDDLKLAASGGGGLQELSGHFENQKVMYGFCSVREPQAALPKYVLVNWVGEDVADARKCACASHVAKIAEFFQGVDVIVNASSVEDVDPGAIGQRLSNGLARTSSPVLHRLRLREDENAEPVGTTYQKTDAAVEMKRLNREQFWEQAKKEEELRKEEERQKVLEERLRFEQERMEQERMEQEEREKRYRERSQSDTHRKASAVGCSPCDSSPASTPVGEQIERALDEVTQQAPRKDSPGPSSEVLAPLTADEPPGDPAWTAAQGGGLGPTEDLVFLEPREPLLFPLALLPAEESSGPTQPPGPESLIDLWQNDSTTPPAAWELATPASPGPPAPLLVEGDLPEPPATFCDAEQDEEPASLIAMEGPHQMTLSYQHALQEAASGQQAPEPQLLTNGEMAQKEGVQASEGYFSQSQDEEFGQVETSAKTPPAVFYAKPPEIDITCWDADPVPEDEESFGGSV